MRRAPEPKILVQDVEHKEGKNKEDSFHDRLSSRDGRLRCLQRKRTLVFGLWTLDLSSAYCLLSTAY
jgi:hypothetical protein